MLIKTREGFFTIRRFILRRGDKTLLFGCIPEIWKHTSPEHRGGSTENL